MDNKEKRNLLLEIRRIQLQLKQTDYKVLKYIEGEISAPDFLPIKAERAELRKKIRELEEQLNG